MTGIEQPQKELRSFLDAVERLRDWTARVPADHRYGEWECEYPDWHEVYGSWEVLLRTTPLEKWPSNVIDAALFAIARDNEGEILAEGLPPAATICLATHAVDRGEKDARWQFAHHLGQLAKEQVEALLLRFIEDDDEYVRRRALQSLARVRSTCAEAVALREWEHAAADNPWSKMNALWVLAKISSADLPRLLEEALCSPDTLLVSYAMRIRSGDVEMDP